MNIEKLNMSRVFNHQTLIRKPLQVAVERELTLEHAIIDYISWKGSYTSRASVTYHTRLKCFAHFIGWQVNISGITVNEIIAYHRYMMDSEYSPKTIAYSTIILKNFFLFLSGRGFRTLNPYELRPLKYLSPEKDLVSEADFELMSDTIDERFFHSLTKKLALHLLWDCGFRVSELCSLDLSSIQETDTPGYRCAKIERRKTNRYNLVYWGTKTNDLLNKYLGMRLAINHPSDSLLICLNGNGKRIGCRTIQRWIKEICKDALIEKNITPHSFRHSKAHRILDKGQNVRDVQCLLGHSSPISSFHYLHLNKTRQMEVARKYL